LHDDKRSPPGGPGVGMHAVEAGVVQVSGKLLGLVGGEPMRTVAARSRWDEALGDQDAAASSQHPSRFGQPSGAIRPMVDGTERPYDGRALIGQRQGFGASLHEGDVAGPSGGGDPTPEVDHRR